MNFASLFDSFHAPREQSYARVADGYREKYAFTPSQDIPSTSSSLLPQFEKASPLIHSLCIPIEMRYGSGKKKPLELTSLQEVRKSEHGHLLRGYSILYNKSFCYLAHEAEEVRIGPDGVAVGSIDEIIDKYRIFHGDGYAKLRRELHFLLYLARQDGLFSLEEKNAVAARVIKHDVPEADRPMVERYFMSSFVTPDAFKNSLKAMNDIPKAEATEIVKAAEDIIKADGKITSSEQAAFAHIYNRLGSA